MRRRKWIATSGPIVLASDTVSEKSRSRLTNIAQAKTPTAAGSAQARP